MGVELKVLSKTKTVTGGHLVSEDYDEQPALCRHGLWVGWKETFIQTVTMGYEHEGLDLVVGWAVNGDTVLDPGYGSAVNFPGQPCPGLPSVRYVTPVDGHYHRISFISTPGYPEQCLSLQALFRRKDSGWQLENGPAAKVCVSGSVIQWPAHLVKEEASCLRHVWEVLKQYAEIGDVRPGDPVQFLGAFPVGELRRLEASAQILERIDEGEQPALAQALRQDVVATLRSRIAVTSQLQAD